MQLRPAEPGDALAVARVHVRSWQHAYRALIPSDYLDQLRPEDRAQRYDFANPDPHAPYTIVAVDDGSIAGFATTSASHDADLPHHGELCALYVDPDRWGRGIGAALVSAARARLRQFGHHKAFLWMLDGNRRADCFYQADGWSSDGHTGPYSVGATTVKKVRYQRDLFV
jgi:GNAT superfamily N-acetyltransferase